MLELDYGMTDGRVELQYQQAFFVYTINRFGRSTTPSGPSPEEQQTCLYNRDEIQSYVDEVLASGDS